MPDVLRHVVGSPNYSRMRHAEATPRAVLCSFRHRIGTDQCRSVRRWSRASSGLLGLPHGRGARGVIAHRTMCCGHRVLTTRACDAGTKGGSQLSYCETVLNSAFFVTVPFLRIKDVWCRQ